MTYPDLYILRHGETEWNVADRMQGRLDSPLTPRGEAQARQQGDILASLDLAEAAIRVSPLGRAQRTAEIALGARAQEQVTDPRLAEIDVGEWSGERRDAIRALRPELFGPGADPLTWYDVAPGGEGLAGLSTRCRAVLGEIDRPAILITHGITSRMLRAIVLGLGADQMGTVGGGQGVVYRLSGGVQTCLS